MDMPTKPENVLKNTCKITTTFPAPPEIPQASGQATITISLQNSIAMKEKNNSPF